MVPRRGLRRQALPADEFLTREPRVVPWAKRRVLGKPDQVFSAHPLSQEKPGTLRQGRSTTCC